MPRKKKVDIENEENEDCSMNDKEIRNLYELAYFEQRQELKLNGIIMYLRNKAIVNIFKSLRNNKENTIEIFKIMEELLDMEEEVNKEYIDGTGRFALWRLKTDELNKKR